jgi:hypothetical protein
MSQKDSECQIFLLVTPVDKKKCLTSKDRAINKAKIVCFLLVTPLYIYSKQTANKVFAIYKNIVPQFLSIRKPLGFF